jgi:hypothetical protein
MTKKFKKKKTNVMFLNLFLNAMIRNIKIHNIFYIIEISKFIKLDKYVQKIYENIHLSVFYDFSKFNGFKKIKV